MIVRHAMVAFSFGRVWAMLLRYLYILRSSWPRTLELLYWPTLQVLIWGYMSQFLYANSSYIARAFGVLLGAVMLWDLMFRSQLGLTISFLEELWSRNLGHLFVTPLRAYEWVTSLLAMSAIRAIFGLVPAAFLAIVLYHYSIFAMGLPLIAFAFVLMTTGWAIGLAICGLILRHGVGAESLAWTVIFEGMRAVLFDHVFRVDYFFTAMALDIVFMAIGIVIFSISFRDARRRGALIQMGE
jgi:ABC-2 type transport system permease protein